MDNLVYLEAWRTYLLLMQHTNLPMYIFCQVKTLKSQFVYRIDLIEDHFSPSWYIFTDLNQIPKRDHLDRLYKYQEDTYVL